MRSGLAAIFIFAAAFSTGGDAAAQPPLCEYVPAYLSADCEKRHDERRAACLRLADPNARSGCHRSFSQIWSGCGRQPAYAAGQCAINVLGLPQGAPQTPSLCDHLLKSERQACEYRLQEHTALCQSGAAPARQRCAETQAAFRGCLPLPPADRAECLRAVLRLPLLQAQILFPACGLLLPGQQAACTQRLQYACTGYVPAPQRRQCLHLWVTALNDCYKKHATQKANCVRAAVRLEAENPLQSYCALLEPAERASCSNILLDWQETCQNHPVKERRAPCIATLQTRFQQCGEAFLYNRPDCVRTALRLAPTNTLFTACGLVPQAERRTCARHLQRWRRYCFSNPTRDERRGCLRALFIRVLYCYNLDEQRKDSEKRHACVRGLLDTVLP